MLEQTSVEKSRTANKATVRHTRQKSIILQALTNSKNFMSAQDLYNRLSENNESIGLATIYRQLNALAQLGKVDTIRLNDMQLYRLCSEDEHHHHLVCEHCHRTEEIELPDEQWVVNIAKNRGFKVKRHTVEVVGICSNCLHRSKS